MEAEVRALMEGEEIPGLTLVVARNTGFRAETVQPSSVNISETMHIGAGCRR